MSRHVEFETTIKGGLPVIVKAVLHPPEPDVGIFEWQPEIHSIEWLKGSKIKFDIDDFDWQKIQDECLGEM